MRIDIMTLFPEMCESVLGESIVGRASAAGLLEIHCRDIRAYTLDKHRRVDDTPYGGGMGMLLQADPIDRCFSSICEETGERPRLIYLSPKGKTLTQQRVRELAALPGLCLLCGHYEGVDERVIEELVDEQISIGDYVLTGGELPALVLTDAVARMLPGVLSDEECFTEESHFSGLLEYPQYTRPFAWHGKEVPAVLLSGHHANIKKWRREQSLLETLRHRPELLEQAELSDADRAFLREQRTQKDPSE